MKDMEFDNIKQYAIIVGGVAILVLTLLAVVDGYGLIVRDNTAVDVDEITVGNVNATTTIGAIGTYPYIQTITDCVNSTDGTAVLESYYKVYPGSDTVAGGFTLLDAGAAFDGDDINCSLTYLAATEGSRAADSFQSGLKIFATFMTIIVLSLVGRFIIRIYNVD